MVTSVEGRETVQGQFGGFLANAESAKFEMKASHVIGNIVINERIDHFKQKDGREMNFHVAGFFFVKDGKIVEWQDYMMPR